MKYQQVADKSFLETEAARQRQEEERAAKRRKDDHHHHLFAFTCITSFKFTAGCKARRPQETSRLMEEVTSISQY